MSGAAAEVEVGFADRLAQLQEAEQLPPLQAPPWRGWDRWVLFPWVAMQDVSALLAWAHHMDGPVAARAEHIAGADATILRLIGMLGGEPVELVGCTHREIDYSGAGYVYSGYVELEVLREVANAERPIAPAPAQQPAVDEPPVDEPGPAADDAADEPPAQDHQTETTTTDERA